MSLVAAVVVVAFGLLLIAFTGMTFAKPAIAEQFLMRFASSARTHYIEQAFRLLIGGALVVLSPAMWHPNVFWLVGWAIVVSSIALMCVPWQWHHEFGERVRPILFRHLRLYAVGSFAFGTLLLYGVFAGAGAAEQSLERTVTHSYNSTGVRISLASSACARGCTTGMWRAAAQL